MTTRVAILGAGTCGRLHAQAWSSLPGVEVASVIDVDRPRGLRLAERYGATFAPSLERAPKTADVVSVCTPSHLHDEQVVLAVRSGSDVLVEKPAATTPEGYARVGEAVRSTGRRVIPAAAGRFYPGVQRAKVWLDEGRIGQPKWLTEYCRLDYSWLPEWYFDPRRSGGGIMLAAGTHSVDRLSWLVGARSLEVVLAETRRYEVPGEAEDYAKAYLYLDDRLPASVEFVWARNTVESRRIDVIGSDGTLRISVSGGVVVETRAGSESWSPCPEGATHAQKAVSGLRSVAGILLDSRRQGADPGSTLADDQRAFEAIRSAYAAASRPKSDRRTRS